MQTDRNLSCQLTGAMTVQTSTLNEKQTKLAH